MLCVAALDHPPYSRAESREMTRRYYGRLRERWPADRQCLKAHDWFPTTYREERVSGHFPRPAATYVRLSSDLHVEARVEP